MMSHDLDMNDLFDNDVGVDDDLEDIGAAPMPGMDDEAEEAPMHEGGEDGDDEDGEGGDVLAKLRALKKGAAKKRVMRPQPKLDADRLKTERGLPLLPKMFENMQFKGKGHEASDLKLMMGKLEHWGHRLFPKCTFDEFIARMEKLGNKKDVQTCLKRVRLDMPLLNEDFMSPNQYDEDEENQEPIPQQTEVEDMDAEEAYDEMIRQEREAMERKRQEEREAEMDEDDLMTSQTPVRTPLGNTQTTPVSSTNKNPVPQTPTSETGKAPVLQNGMTPDQQERIERNKMMALQKRAARLGVPVSDLLPRSQAEPKTPNQPTDANSKTGSQESNIDSNETSTNSDNNNQANDVQQNENNITNELESEEKTPPATKSKSYQNSEESLHLKLSESEATNSKADSEGVGTLRLSATENESEGVGTLRISHTEVDQGSTQNKLQSDNIRTVSKEQGQNDIDMSSPEKNTKVSDNKDANTENDDVMDDVGVLQLDATETPRKQNDTSQKNKEISDNKEGKYKESSSALEDAEEPKLVERSAEMSEEEPGLCLQLSDSTNTTQEEEDLES